MPKRSATSSRRRARPVEGASEIVGRLFVAHPPAAERDATTDAIIAAAYDQFASLGIRRSTMEDVAKRAGVSRITVYRRFADKEKLMTAVVLREAERFFGTFRDAVARHANIEDQMAEGLIVLLRFTRTHELFGRLLETEPETVLPHLTSRGMPLVEAARTFLAAQLERGKKTGHIAEGVPSTIVAEVCVRLAHSLMLTPESALPIHDEAALRDLFRSGAPFLRVLATPKRPSSGRRPPKP